jgi:glutamate synthase (NADPH/NADH) large chain
MRVCHLDTCPVGVATQNPELRARFSGKPEFVETFFEYLAQEVREYLAELGFRSLDEIIGHSELLDVDRAIEHWKADGLDLTPVLIGPEFADDEPRRNRRPQKHELAAHFDQELIRLASMPWTTARRCASSCPSATPSARSEPCWATRSPSGMASTASRRAPSRSS